MKKTEIKKLLKPVLEKDEYNKRLDLPYFKMGLTKTFRSQYDRGDGHELNSHFWSKISSSRIAFDLYSCLANENNVDDIEVEFALPGIKSGSRKPNMDIYYSIGDTVYFIESKFTEVPGTKESILPEAYYIKQENYHSANGKIVSKSIKDRFIDEEEIGLLFSDFCYKHKNKISSHDEKDWFDYKQEICHLFGIIFYGIQKADISKIKNINFRNIVYKFDEYVDEFGEEGISSQALEFIQEGKLLVQKIFDLKGINVKFSYNYAFTQNIVDEFSEKAVFGMPKIKIGEFMKRYYI